MKFYTKSSDEVKASIVQGVCIVISVIVSLFVAVYQVDKNRELENIKSKKEVYELSLTTVNDYLDSIPITDYKSFITVPNQKTNYNQINITVDKLMLYGEQSGKAVMLFNNVIDSNNKNKLNSSRIFRKFLCDDLYGNSKCPLNNEYFLKNIRWIDKSNTIPYK